MNTLENNFDEATADAMKMGCENHREIDRIYALADPGTVTWRSIIMEGKERIVWNTCSILTCLGLFVSRLATSAKCGSAPEL